VPTLPELLEALSALQPEQAAAILARAVPAPLSPPPQSGASPIPWFASWADFIAQTTPAERRPWCTRKAKKANGTRLMSGSPSDKISADDVWQVLVAARGAVCLLRLTRSGESAIPAGRRTRALGYGWSSDRVAGPPDQQVQRR